MSNRGYFGIGIFHPKHDVNVGGLWRHAHLYGASFVFTVGRRFRKEASDTAQSWRHIPMYHFDNYESFKKWTPYSCPIVAVEEEMEGVVGFKLPTFAHPERCIYLLGAEDHGLPASVLYDVHQLLSIPSPQRWSMNVTHAGTIVMYDRFVKRG